VVVEGDAVRDDAFVNNVGGEALVDEVAPITAFGFGKGGLQPDPLALLTTSLVGKYRPWSEQKRYFVLCGQFRLEVAPGRGLVFLPHQRAM
jgi:hypothetical protein